MLPLVPLEPHSPGARNVGLCPRGPCTASGGLGKGDSLNRFDSYQIIPASYGNESFICNFCSMKICIFVSISKENVSFFSPSQINVEKNDFLGKSYLCLVFS